MFSGNFGAATSQPQVQQFSDQQSQQFSQQQSIQNQQFSHSQQQQQPQPGVIADEQVNLFN